jgi:Prokaryotic RING finger family 1
MTRLLQKGLARVCPFCKSSLFSESIIRCTRCGTSHHKACWIRHGRCSIFGCSASMMSRPAAISRWLLVLGVLLLPVIVLFVLISVTFAVFSFEFGTTAGLHLIQRGVSVIPALFITLLLFCGIFSFYSDL